MTDQINKSPFLPTTACILYFLATTCGACKSDYPASANEGRQKSARTVKTARVSEVPVGESITVSGTLAAYEQATVGVKVPGRLQNINVDLGTAVHKGQAIAQLEQEDYQLRVQQANAALGQARARLGLSPAGTDDRVNPEQTATVRQARAVMEQARVNRDRAATLFKQDVVARAELDTTESAYKVAQGSYQDALEEIHNREALLAQRRSESALARQQLSDTVVYSPLDGIVQEKKVSVGEYLAAGAPVASIVRMDPLRLRAEVPERESHNVHRGQGVRVSVEGDPNVYPGQIMRLSPTIIEQNRVLMVEADVSNNGGLRPGSFARADIVTSDSKMVVTVPANAIVTFAGIEKVILADNGKAMEKAVTTGRHTPEWVEIVSGINVGDQVVIDPGNLQSGQPIDVAE